MVLLRSIVNLSPEGRSYQLRRPRRELAETLDAVQTLPVDMIVPGHGYVKRETIIKSFGKTEAAVGRGKLTACVKDADGNITGLIQEP